MQSKFTVQVLIATLALSGTVTFKAEAVPPTIAKPTGTAPSVAKPQMPNPGYVAPGGAVAQTTIFRCVNSGSDFATVAQKGAQTTPPLIVWKSYAFGPEYTPQNRCQQVSSRLTNAVANNGGSLKNLRLTAGLVNRQTVVCYTNGAASCNNTNMLFTLKPENARNAGDVLAKLVTFSQRGSGSAVFESGGGSEPNASVSLEEVVDQAFESGGSVENTPEETPNVSTPENVPDSQPLEGGI